MTNFYFPPIALEALRSGADCAIGISGGKDSMALLLTFAQWFRAEGFSGQLFAIFAHLGRSEWWQTEDFVKQLCAGVGIELVIVRREQGDLLDRFDQRRKSVGPDTPFWPTNANRYCSGDLKRTPIDKYLRHFRLVISLEGIRAAESDSRAEKSPFSIRTAITGVRYRLPSPEEAWALYRADRDQPVLHSLFEDLPEIEGTGHAMLPRLSFTWYPLFDWGIEAVWQACGTSLSELKERRALYQKGVVQEDQRLRDQAFAGWLAHPAYILGANRLSCSLCILADIDTLRAGAQHNPEYYRTLCLREAESGYSFKQGMWLCDVAPELLTEEIRFLLSVHPRRIAWLHMQQQKRRRTLRVVSAG